MENIEALPKVFRTVVESLIRCSPEHTRDWQLVSKAGNTELVIPKLAEEGFKITVVADDSEVSVYSEYLAHEHFTSDGDHEAVSNQAMGLVRDLLSPLMRLRVTEVKGSVIRARFEVMRDGAWKAEAITGLLAFSFFSKRTEKFFINRRMPIRKKAYA